MVVLLLFLACTRTWKDTCTETYIIFRARVILYCKRYTRWIKGLGTRL